MKKLTILLLLKFSLLNLYAMDLDSIVKKISEGYARIGKSDKDKEAWIIVGNTGSGKTTFAHLVRGSELFGVFNDQTGELVIDTGDTETDMKISHNKCSETKIPNKCQVNYVNKCETDSIVLWDCPGFNDTNVAQEIANSFHLKKLYSQHQKIKFVLVISEGSLSDRGTPFVNILNQFILGFKDINKIKQSVLLVITSVSPNKNIVHMKNILKGVLEYNDRLDTNSKELLNILIEKVLLFHAPNKEGELAKKDIINELKDKAIVVTCDNQSTKFSLSSEAREYCGKILDFSSSTIESLTDNILEIISHIGNKLQANAMFENHYNKLKIYFPDHINYMRKNDDNHFTNQTYFLDIKFLHEFSAVISSAAILEKNNFQDTVNLIEILYNTVEDFLKINNNNDSHLLTKIQALTYTLSQMRDYVALFSELLNDKSIDYQIELAKKLNDKINKIFPEIKNKLNSIISNLNLDTSITDILYYQEAEKFLQLVDSDNCQRKRSLCLEKLGDIEKCHHHFKEATNYYVSSLKLNRFNDHVYESLGDMFKEDKRYNDAIMCYKLIRHPLKLKQCCKSYLQEVKESYKVYEIFAEIWRELGFEERASKYFMMAQSLCLHNDKKNELQQKMGPYSKEMLKEDQENRYRNFPLESLDNVSNQ